MIDYLFLENVIFYKRTFNNDLDFSRIKKRLPRQARSSHPQRRLKMGIIVVIRSSDFHFATIIQQFFLVAIYF
jgi:hypothetical protein